MASDRQIEANCLNAQKSTGPKTEEGKAASRDNAWKHGMAAEVDELRSPAFLARRASWGQEFRPRTESAEWALDRAVAASLRIDRCDAEFHTMIVDHAERAAINWDLDREAEVAAFARRLDKQPELLSRRLQTSRHGCEWMIEAWNRLRIALEANGELSDAETSFALDLLGLHKDLRRGRTPLDPPADVDRKTRINQIIDGEIEELLGKKARGLDRLDDLYRDHALRGLGVELTPKCQLLLRYERDAHRRYHRALRDVGTIATPAPAPVVEAPQPVATAVKDRPAPAPAPVPAPIPPLSTRGPETPIPIPSFNARRTDDIVMVPLRR